MWKFICARCLAWPPLMWRPWLQWLRRGMDERKNFALRKARKGTGVLPPNPNRWEHEHNGLDLRHELSLPLDKCLLHIEAFRLLPNVHVFSDRELSMEPRFVAHFS